MFCSKCGAKVSDDALFCAKCGNKISRELEKNNGYSQEIIKSSYTTEQIKEYLGHAKTLEVNRYTLITARNRLQQIINGLGISKNFSCPISKASEGFNSFWSIFFSFFVIGLIISVFVCGDANDSIVANILSIITVVLIFFNTELLIGVAVSAAVSLLMSLIICLIRTAGKKAEYKSEYKKYLRLRNDDEQRVTMEKEQIKALQKQQRDISTEIAKTEKMLTKLYSFDVIKPKYRELIPIVTMYEYFDYERCYDLVGTAGAYNLFESESRQDIIISNLNQVITMLSRIEKNQHALYEAIQESNYYAERVYNQANSMLKSCKAIEHNSAIAAYNTKLAADNTSISAYIDLCQM